jgi:hypothetical protein
MKKLLIILVAAILCLPGFSGNDWVDAGNGKIDCKRINLRMTKANVLQDDGQRVEVSFRDIKSFSRNGKEFIKLRLYEDNKPTKKMAFMELVGTWNNLKLVKLPVSTIGVNSIVKSSQYYIYDGTKFHLQLDDRTLRNTCSVFGLDYAKM